MSRTIEMSEKSHKSIERENVYGDSNTLNIPLSVSLDRAVGYEITHSALQGFVGEEGVVTPHTEDDGVTEIYFPLSGTFLAQRDGEIVTLEGTHADLKDIDMRGQLTVSDDLQNATLTIKTKDGQEEIITGFIIPAGTQHDTKLQPIKGQVCRYVAVKVRSC